MSSRSFYQDLPAVTDFSSLADPAVHAELPADWSVVTADIKDSTAAMTRGEYKKVNAVGVCVITAVWNAAKPLLIPYVFGGDGATLCVPPDLVRETSRVLRETRKLAREAFGLDLRIGMMPVEEIREAGKRILVAKFQVSKYCTQAAFLGGGIAYAENFLKSSGTGQFGRAETDAAAGADYSGFECRWKNIASPRGETVALLVKAHPQLESQAQCGLYREVMQTIRAIYGDWAECHPLSRSGLRIALDPGKLMHELKVRTFGRGGSFGYMVQMMALNIFGKAAMRFGLKSSGIFWGCYKDQLLANADTRKFDDMFRAVISGSAGERERLLAYLEEGRQRKRLFYGIHVARSALMTCLIRDYGGEHYHFIDGAEGGYAAAAVELKKSMTSAP